ncbi:MAG: hypothetical protein KBF99_10180 [Leptospiraceae bacterium]|nr:hypothetical protein [Leptospiraceae bacterium]MBK9497870.1 hypothetical protein [Leptospiraceae bacterium]MBP9163539.1 hypothetical protein [Leptospiraceae bacterium]
MTTFAIEVTNQKQAKALFAFLKTLDSVKISEVINSKRSNTKIEDLTEERKLELDRRIASLGKEKTYKAKEVISYARQRIRTKN